MVAMATFSSSPTSSLAPTSAFRLLPDAGTMGRDALYLLAGLPAGIVTFSVLVTGLSLAAGLAITLLGIPVLLATLYAARAMGDAERWRAGWVLGTPIQRADRPWRGGLWTRFTTSATDAGAWRDTVHGLLLMPLGVLGFTVAVTVWSTALGMATSPAWMWAVPEDDDRPDNWALDLLNSHAVAPSIGRVALGLLLIPVAAWTCRALADALARGARALLAH
jgi:hypothetical protein